MAEAESLVSEIADLHRMLDARRKAGKSDYVELEKNLAVSIATKIGRIHGHLEMNPAQMLYDSVATSQLVSI